ncbi:MAG: DUF2809 domain-containing protein [Verrucomicrobia bacterium]|nr:DUF2809 domain-containing protein [Verrucomicrobiota bacterium]
MRWRLGILIVALIPAGFYVKYFVSGDLGTWCNIYGGAILYEVFWIAVLAFLFTRWSALACSLIVFLTTCALEFLQLWHPAWLEPARNTIIGQALLGSVFDPYDFIYYVIGSLLGGLIVWSFRHGAWSMK